MTPSDAITLIQEYEKSREILTNYFSGLDETAPDREIVISMLNELAETIERIQGSVRDSKRKLFPWSPDWMERFSIPSFEDELIEQLDNQKDGLVDEVEFSIRFDLNFLTTRQKDCLTMVADGCTYIDTANMLGVKKGTVSKHLQLARKKARDSVQLCLF